MNCLVCGANNKDTFCKCQRTWLESDLRLMTSLQLVSLLQECLTGPLAQERILRQAILVILLQKEDK